MIIIPAVASAIRGSRQTLPDVAILNLKEGPIPPLIHHFILRSNQEDHNAKLN